MSKQIYKDKFYTHFDKKKYHTNYEQSVQNINWVSRHGFYPFIHFQMDCSKYTNDLEGNKFIKEKNRDIYYAAHIDRFIYEYYGNRLNSKYNNYIRNKYRMLKSITDKSEGKIVILDMICFEYLILAFDKLVEWTGTGKTDKIKIRDKVLVAVENHRIDLSKIDDEKTLQYIAGFKRYSTERVMKSLVGEFTQNEKWSVKGTLMGECWYKDCCVSEHTDNLRCGKPEVESGDEKMRMLIRSEEVQRLMRDITLKE